MNCQWTNRDLIHATQGYFYKEKQFIATGISIDSRTLKKGNIFIALKSNKNDGHSYISKAIEAGATCIIVSEIPSNLLNISSAVLCVPDTLVALGQLGKYARERFKGKMIAITGSVGKTTTKEMLKQVLSTFGSTHAAFGSYNNHLGVPLTLANLPQNAEFCICEIGMNHPGEIAPLSHQVKPDIAIITLITTSHLGYMHSLDNIALEKSEITFGLSMNGAIVIPENLYGLSFLKPKLAAKNAQLIQVGPYPHCNISITNIHLDKLGSTFTVTINHHSTSFQLKAPGQHLIQNAGLVIATTHYLGLDIKKTAEALSNFKVDSGRGKQIFLKKRNIVVLDESYNASVLSICAALQTLQLIAPKRKIAILGDIKELGTYSETEHLSLIPPLIKTIDLFFACGPMMKIVFDHLPKHLQGSWRSKAKELVQTIYDHLTDYDTLLIKGSHSMNTTIIINDLTNLIEGDNNAL